MFVSFGGAQIICTDQTNIYLNKHFSKYLNVLNG